MLSMNILKQYVIHDDIEKFKNITLSDEFKEELFYFTLSKCEKTYDKNKTFMLKIFLKNVKINPENYLIKRYENETIDIKNDYLRHFLIEQKIIKFKTIHVFNNNFIINIILNKFNHLKTIKKNYRDEMYIFKHLDVSLCYFSLTKKHDENIFHEEIMSYIFNDAPVIFYSDNLNFLNHCFKRYPIKRKSEKCGIKLLNYIKRKNALMFIESIKNENTVLSKVFNNLHLKIEIVKFL